jgi:uncharacterized protein (DUF2249 family)
MQIISLDVSDLAPPEPMSAILQSLSTLAENSCLRIKHRREPFPLYKKLVDAGLAYHCEVHSNDNITLYIYHLRDAPSFEQIIKGHQGINE